MAAGELAVNLVANTSQFNKTMKQVARDMKALGKDFQTFGAAMTKATLPLAALGAAGIAASLQLDDAFDKIRIGTGATGDQLTGLQDDFKKVFGSVPVSAADASTAIADLNTRMGLSGVELQELSTQMLNLARITGEDVGGVIAKTTRLFGDWSIPVEKSGDTLDYLFKVSQSTGIGITDLSDKMVQFGAPLRNMGFDFETSAALMGKFEKEGVNLELVMGSLRQAMKKFSDQGIDANDGLKQIIQQIKDAETPTKAAAMAFEIFGARAGGDMADAIRGGRFEIDDLVKSLGESSETINKAAEDTDDFKEKLILLKNNATLALEPIGTILLNAVIPAFDKLVKVMQSVAMAFQNMNPNIQQAIVLFGAALTAIGPVVFVLGSLIKNIGLLIPLIGTFAKALTGLILVMTGPAGIVIAAGAVITALIYFQDEVGEALQGLMKMTDYISGILLPVLNRLTLGFADTIDQQDKLSNSTKALRTATQSYVEKGGDAAAMHDKLSKEVDSARATMKRLADQKLQNSDLYKKQIAIIESNKTQLAILGKNISTVTTETKKSSGAQKELIETNKDATRINKDLTNEINKSTDATDKKTKATSAAEKEQEKLTKQMAELARLVKNEADPAIGNFKDKLTELIALNPDKKMEELADEIANVGQEALAAGASVGELKAAVEEVGSAKTGGIFDSLLNFDLGKDVMAGFGQEIGSQLQQSLSGVVTSIFDGKSIRAELGGIATSLGSTIGAKFGPLGAMAGEAYGKQFGQILEGIGKSTAGNMAAITSAIFPPLIIFGDKLTKVFDKAFGGASNAAANARQEFANFMNDAIAQANKAGNEIQKFIIPGGRDAFDPFINAAGETTTVVGDMFATLDQETQERFLNLGTAFATIFDNEDLNSGQLGQMLAINFGMGENSLNDLQIALQAAGVTAEQMSGMLEAAFMKGEIGAEAFLGALAETNNLFTQGIPDGIGRTDKAIQNLISGGLKSGAVAMDAFGDIAVEAMENGLTSVDQLRQHLIDMGMGVEDADRFMAAMAANGIGSLQDLANITGVQTAQMLAHLNNAGFGFEQVGKEIDRLHDKLDKIKSKEIDVKVNVKYTASGDIPPKGGEVIASAKGNVFDNGNLVKFAKGGILDAPVTFPLNGGRTGLAGEAGPEAIMPLTRGDDGALGINAHGLGKTENINITVDARGAEIGAARRIRRELEEFFDTRNNEIGSRN
jgi:TP901 family phage tail tape measure protein